jgi:anti-sigma factor RsiW
MNCEEARELLEAYHDEELMAEARSAVAAHVRHCEECAAELASLGGLSGAIKAVGPFPVPESLRRNVEKLAADARRANTAIPRRFGFRALAASHIGIAAAAGLAAYAVAAQGYSRSFATQEAISAHVRSLMDDRLVQVTSSDSHTVHPWFAGKIDFSPDVRDFASVGYPLVGGRVDYVGTTKVAVLVYSHGKHVINVFVSPAGSLDLGLPHETSRNGYTVIEWRNQDLRYRAVSDLNTAELQEFVRALKSSPATAPQS